ncbi:MAG: GSU2403 family nucleotidyltransferase fold protein [Hyphomicrobiales bacterium]
MKPIPLSIQTIYAELLQRVGTPDGLRGSLYQRMLKGTRYTYLKRQRGRQREDRFIGRSDDPHTAETVAAIKRANAAAAENRKLVRILRGSGIPAPVNALGAVLDVLAEAGLTGSMVIVGTAAYQCYSPIVGYSLPAASLTTQDADLATATLALAPENREDTLETILKRADPAFAAVPSLDPRQPPSRFRSANGFIVDLLTPQFRRSDRNPMPLPGLAAGAVPMQHLDWLIENPIHAVALHGAGIPLRVPQPARYAIHKLIVAQKRAHDAVKRTKDLHQAKSLIEALRHSDPWALRDAYEHAAAQGERGWRRPIDRSLKELGIEPEALRA